MNLVESNIRTPYVLPNRSKYMWLCRFVAMLLLLFGISIVFGIPRLQNDARMDEMEMLLLNSAPEGSQITGVVSGMTSHLRLKRVPGLRKTEYASSLYAVLYMETDMTHYELAGYYKDYSFGNASIWLEQLKDDTYVNVDECENSADGYLCRIVIEGDLARKFDVRRYRTSGFFCGTGLRDTSCVSWDTCVPSVRRFLKTLWAAFMEAVNQ